MIVAAIIAAVVIVPPLAILTLSLCKAAASDADSYSYGIDETEWPRG